MGDEKRLFIALPAFGQTCTTETTMSLLRLSKALFNSGWDYYGGTLSYPEIDELRNMFLTLWYDTRPDSSHILFLDADMGFEPQLVLDMIEFDKPLVGCVYPKKTNPIEFVLRRLPNPSARIENGFMELDGFGFGVTLIRRDCVDALLNKGNAISDDRLSTHIAGPMLKEFGLKRIIRAFDRIEGETGRLAEDLSFCRRYRECGGEVWGNINHSITHVGQHGFKGRFMDKIESRLA